MYLKNKHRLFCPCSGRHRSSAPKKPSLQYLRKLHHLPWQLRCPQLLHLNLNKTQKPLSWKHQDYTVSQLLLQSVGTRGQHGIDTTNLIAYFPTRFKDVVGNKSLFIHNNNFSVAKIQILYENNSIALSELSKSCNKLRANAVSIEIVLHKSSYKTV